LTRNGPVFSTTLILFRWTGIAEATVGLSPQSRNTNAYCIHCRYSSLSEADKAAAFRLWQKKWDRFIEQTLEMPSYQWCRQGEFSNCEISP